MLLLFFFYFIVIFYLIIFNKLKKQKFFCTFHNSPELLDMNKDKFIFKYLHTDKNVKYTDSCMSFAGCDSF